MSAKNGGWTAKDAVLLALGIAYAALLVAALYYGWQNWRPGLVGLVGRNGLAPLPADWRFLFTWEEDLRIPLQLIAAILVLTFADWLWRMTLGRLSGS